MKGLIYFSRSILKEGNLTKFAPSLYSRYYFLGRQSYHVSKYYSKSRQGEATRKERKVYETGLPENRKNLPTRRFLRPPPDNTNPASGRKKTLQLSGQQRPCLRSSITVFLTIFNCARFSVRIAYLPLPFYFIENLRRFPRTTSTSDKFLLFSLSLSLLDTKKKIDRIQYVLIPFYLRERNQLLRKFVIPLLSIYEKH